MERSGLNLLGYFKERRVLTNRGFTLVELMIALVVAAILYALAAPTLTAWIADSRVRVTAESIQTGIFLARTEAIRRNATVRFQLTDGVDNTCALTSTGTSWVVSQNDATAKCGVAPSDITDPRIVQLRSGREGGAMVTVSAVSGGAGATTIIFNGTGRIAVAGFIDTIDIGNPSAGTCQHSGGDIRCLRIRILPGGDSRICDPKVVDVNDLRRCP